MKRPVAGCAWRLGGSRRAPNRRALARRARNERPGEGLFMDLTTKRPLWTFQFSSRCCESATRWKRQSLSGWPEGLQPELRQSPSKRLVERGNAIVPALGRHGGQYRVGEVGHAFRPELQQQGPGNLVDRDDSRQAE